MIDQVIRYGNQGRSFNSLLGQIAEIWGIRDLPHIKDLLLYVKDGPINLRVDQDSQKWITTKQFLFLQGLLHTLKTDCPTHSSTPDEVESLRADIRELRQLFNFKHQFPQFRNLPPEIRVMIWGYATPPRFIEVTSSNRLIPLRVRGKFNGLSVPPATAQVCRESRAVACRYGRLVPIIKPQFGSQSNSEASNPDSSDETSQSDSEASEFESSDETSQSDFGNNEPQPKPNWCWFDPSRDSLFISQFSDIPEFVAKYTEHITLSSPVLGSMSASFFPRVKHIDCVEWTYSLPESLDFILEARLFGCNLDNSLVIDVNDIDALIQKVEKDYSSDHLDGLRRMRSNIPDKCGSDWIKYAMRRYHDDKSSCPTFRCVVQIELWTPSPWDNGLIY
ncbi:hypothetical protein F4821DRAFT_126519 [Hypoxylon rubiginosum]|uniref:Uncharacterized protein n=1 Tax=Hypoxylon rubiginosum TaxID=110542 RepID=A0ACC0D1Q9_9PEZI|nr:hypothetical protein F4821DRAFT_126519 [Hypoxylon rubiginosum]